jgi:DNA-directed RNA polymerase subunit RPC12/RpoP
MAAKRNTHAFFATPSLHCPDCGAPMRLLTITPSTSTPATDEIVYRCEVCSVEMKDDTLQPAAA